MERDFGSYFKHSLYLSAAFLLLLAAFILMVICGIGVYFDVLYSAIPMMDKGPRFLRLPDIFGWGFSINTSITEIIGTVVIFDLEALLSKKKIIRFGKIAVIFLRDWAIFWFLYDLLTNIVGAWLATKQIIPTILLTVTTTFADILFIGALSLFISAITYLRDVLADFQKAIGKKISDDEQEAPLNNFNVVP